MGGWGGVCGGGRGGVGRLLSGAHGSPLAGLFIEASMGLYAASARPCPRRHQSSSAPGLLAATQTGGQSRGLPGTSIGDGGKRGREREREAEKTRE